MACDSGISGTEFPQLNSLSCHISGVFKVLHFKIQSLDGDLNEAALMIVKGGFVNMISLCRTVFDPQVLFCIWLHSALVLGLLGPFGGPVVSVLHPSELLS